MQKLALLSAFALVTLLAQVFLSCECQRTDCGQGYFSVQFLSQADSSDLFENGTYQRDSLRLFVMHESVTSDYTHQLYYWQNEQYPLSVTIQKDVSGYIFQFNSQERDTLDVDFTVSEGGKCCPGEAVATYGIFKGDTIYPNASGYLILKK